jgi:hypothetical protein
MTEAQMSKDIDQDRRRFFGCAAVTAAVPFTFGGCTKAQPAAPNSSNAGVFENGSE